MSIDLTKGIVCIINSAGEILGAGFALTDDGLIATCAHVIADAGVGPGETINFVFHCTGEERQAVVEADWWREPDAEDVAILRLIGELSEQVNPLPLGASAGVANHPFETMGFPTPNPTGGILGSGTILGLTRINEIRVLQLRSQEVTGGFSGAPVWDSVKRRVVGMVTATADPDGRWRLAETAFITPTEILRAVCPALQLSDLCPYRSLEAFCEADAEFFFGRERVVERLVESLRREPRFLAVLGPSGSGKSSLVQAGLIPHLRRGAVPGSDRWGVMVARPTEQPFHQLAAQGLTGAPEDLAGAVQAWLENHPDQERLVLVLDQFEELMVTAPQEVRLAFLAQLTALLEASLPVTIVLVLRNDFYSRFAREATALLPWLERGLVNVPPMLTRAELQDIIAGPARAVGLTFEAGLVVDILQNALESAAAGEEQMGRSTILPLLEFALTQLWERRQDGVMTHEAYEAIDGVTGGLTRWADQSYYGLGKEHQRLARRLLTDLVHLGDESQGLPDSRRRRPLETLYRSKPEQEAVHEVVRRLADARLLVTGRDLEREQEVVELIHDALLQEWGLLHSWLEEDRRFLAWRQALEERLRLWEESAPAVPTRRDPGRLLRGRDLAEAERWLTERWDDLRTEEQAFIEISLTRARRVRRLIVGAVTLAFLVVSVLALLAWSQRNQAIHEAEVRATAQAQAEERRQEAEAAQATAVVESEFRATAQAQAEAAQATAVAETEIRATAQAQTEIQRNLAMARQLAAQAQLALDNTGTGPVRSVLLGVEAMRRLPSLEADQALRPGTALLPYPVARLTHERGAVEAIAFSPDSKWLATGSLDFTARVWEPATGQEIARMEHQQTVLTVAFSPDGRWLATGSQDGTARVWDVGSKGQEVARMTHEGDVVAVTFSPNGRWLATASVDGTSHVLDMTTDQEILRLEHQEAVLAVAFSPDGSWFATGSNDGTIRVWEASTWNEVARLAHQDTVLAVAFSPDDRWLATASFDGTTRIREVSTWKEVSRLEHEAAVVAVAFSPDAQWLATGSWDKTARVWDVAVGQEVIRLEHEDRVVAVTFSPDSRWLATGSLDTTARVWKVAEGQEVARIGHKDWVYAVAFSPDGQWLVTGGADGNARVWDAFTGQEITRLDDEKPLDVMAFSPDGQWLATGSLNGNAWVWNALTGQKLTQLANVRSVSAIAFSSNGRLLATINGDSIIQVWDTVTGHQVTRIEDETAAWTVAFSPDGRWLATASLESTVRVWEVTTGKEVARLEHETPAVSPVVFSPDGRRLVTGGSVDGIAQMWDVFSGQKIPWLAQVGEVLTLAFSPDGRWLAAGNGDGTAQILDAATGREVVKVAHEDDVEVAAFSPDSQWLATGSDDNTVRIWEAATGQEMVRLKHENSILGLAFSSDGHWLVTGSSDGTIRKWLWRPEDLIAEACARLTRNLTRTEWEQYLPGEPYRPTCPDLPVPEE